MNLPTAIACMSVSGLIGMFIGYIDGEEDSSASKQARRAVQACEKSLPRDQTCIAVITAKVKDKNL